ncbi:MAG: hypothetical protein HOH19_05105 [Kordiimonadaceae bacterium]|nr:hypothetical protein [Kordiimonadaceae bacterium]MBT6031932.1 hypothetical protein [Kordiimonadaceae bacterium]
MNTNIILFENYKKPVTSELKENANIFIEMEQLGIDPDPFLEIAALDLFKQYGASSYDYSIKIQDVFLQNYDFGAAEIWQKIAAILLNLQQSSNAVTH